ncbi:hypothetical protein CEE37_13000 [candidate division LCP-89 bacterium B3_LCP]|uniref:Uncharacterized protein n=1 Tax=candidate division LCP-89 bacterium B3_LCP TaxID=2012998 RepID=A0A532UU11_UNCL8|nr:MAG: hypothetical protein CEE37_13000 [candidate division LCP-89 bacterium B3_LCP]
MSFLPAPSGLWVFLRQMSPPEKPPSTLKKRGFQPTEITSPEELIPGRSYFRGGITRSMPPFSINHGIVRAGGRDSFPEGADEVRMSRMYLLSNVILGGFQPYSESS